MSNIQIKNEREGKEREVGHRQRQLPVFSIRKLNSDDSEKILKAVCPRIGDFKMNQNVLYILLLFIFYKIIHF